MQEEFIFKLAADVEPEAQSKFHHLEKVGKQTEKHPNLARDGSFTAPRGEKILQSSCQGMLEEGKDLGLDARTVPGTGIN